MRGGQSSEFDMATLFQAVPHLTAATTYFTVPSIGPLKSQPIRETQVPELREYPESLVQRFAEEVGLLRRLLKTE